MSKKIEPFAVVIVRENISTCGDNEEEVLACQFGDPALAGYGLYEVLETGLLEHERDITPSMMNDYLAYLDNLRESGITNMYGSGPYLATEFDISIEDAHAIVAFWMQTFHLRHPEPTQ